MSMRRRYIYFLLTYFHNSSKKAHITKYSIKSIINSTEAKIKLSFQRADSTFSTWSLALSFLTRDARASRDGQLAILWQHCCFICRHTYNIMPVVCPVSSNWPAATPTGHFLSGPSSDPSARHVLVRPFSETLQEILLTLLRWKLDRKYQGVPPYFLLTVFVQFCVRNASHWCEVKSCCR